MNGLNEMGNNEIEIERLSTPIMKIVNNLLFSKNVIKRKKKCQKKAFCFRLIKVKIHLLNQPFHILLALVAELHQTAAVGRFLRH